MNNTKDEILNANIPTHLHAVENAGALDSRIRHRWQNPEKILRKYIRPGMTVVDLGCGTGYFTLEMARLTGKNGKVIAADVQEGMLEILRQKLKDSEWEPQVRLIRKGANTLGFTEKADFILAFYTLHEMASIDSILRELKEIMKPETRILISEQKIHVPNKIFQSIVHKMKENGFVVCERPKIFFSRTIVMKAVS